MRRTIMSDFMADPRNQQSPSRASGPDHIYVNVGIINANSNQDTLTSPVKIAQFVETRNVPLIDDSYDWDYSIVRFNIDGFGALLPLWIPQIAVGAANPTGDINQTVYQLTIVQPGEVLSPNPPVTLKFVTAFPSLPPPAAPGPGLGLNQDVTNIWYYGKSYAQFVAMVNEALQTAWGQIPSLGFDIPTLRYDPATKLFSFTSLDEEYVTHDTPGAWPHRVIQFNPALAALFNGFNWQYNCTDVGMVPNWYTLVVDPIAPTVLPATITQDFNSTSNGLWTPIDGFSFVTNFIPVSPEQGTAPTQLGVSNVGIQGATTQLGYTNVLTDYNVTGFPEEALSSLEYVPSAEYRVGNLMGHGSIQSIDVQVFWRYRLTGQLVQLLIPNNSSMSLKLLFRKKAWRSAN